MMGLDPMDIKFIRIAHEMGLGCGDVDRIEIAGDEEAARENWGFEGPFQNLTFAARMQHKIYWGKLKSLLEWSLKTWLAPWAYIASVLYHDVFWYPRRGKRAVAEALKSDWGRLFHNWDRITPDEAGWKNVDGDPPQYKRSTASLVATGFKILWTCLKEAPEFATRKRRRGLKRRSG
jgi:hypothetical protein